MNLEQALYPEGSGRYFDATSGSGFALTNAQKSRTALVTLSGTDRPLKATLVWADPPSPPGSIGGLVHDLDLRVVRRNLGGTGDEATFLPKLPGGAGTGDDATNNVEQIEVTGADLIAGRVYRIEVSIAADLVSPYLTQSFALVVTGTFSAPTPAGVTDWRASRRGSRALLTWRVSQGADVAGFHVLRASRPEGPFQRVTPHLLPAREGQNAHRYLDARAPAAGAYYQLEVVSVDGRRERHGLACCPAR